MQALKAIILQLKTFVLAQKVLYWALILFFCGAGTFVNYGWGLKAYLRSLQGPQAFACYFTLYALFTGVGYLLYSLINKDFSYWKKQGFPVLLFLSVTIFAFRSSFYGHAALIERISPAEQAYINRLVYGDLFRLSYLVIPVFIVWFVADRKVQPLYGVSAQNHKWKVYLMLLLCMVPLIAFVSTQSDFLEYYPRLKKLTSQHAPFYKLLVYELCYGLDYISIELFFRGFMIMAFAKYVGINSVLPTACFYLSIHFGKPLGEAVSSFFGGTILGVISYHTRSIYGGVIIHIGIAWLMEAGGLIGNWVKSNP